MKKSLALLSALGMAFILCACGANNTNTAAPAAADSSSDAAASTETSYNIVGTWTQVDAPESYSVLELKEDGTGSMMTMPEEIGVALSYEFEGTTLTTHLGAADDNTVMEYLPETDQIKFIDTLFAR